MRERRFKKARRSHKVFLVICEGETEAAYVETLKQHYRLPITIKTRISGNTINSRIVREYIKELGIGNDDECRVFYIYDADVECIADRLRSMTGNLVLSNPCIELWFILHSLDYKRSESSQSVVKHLCACHPVWKSYGKGTLTTEQKKHLLSSLNEALTRAGTLRWPENPSSNMHVFIDALESEKR